MKILSKVSNSVSVICEGEQHRTHQPSSDCSHPENIKIYFLSFLTQRGKCWRRNELKYLTFWWKKKLPWKICTKRCCFSHFPEQFELNKMLFCRLLSFLPVDSYVENCQNRDGSQVEKYQVKPIDVNLKKKKQMKTI